MFKIIKGVTTLRGKVRKAYPRLVNVVLVSNAFPRASAPASPIWLPPRLTENKNKGDKMSNIIKWVTILHKKVRKTY